MSEPIDPLIKFERLRAAREGLKAERNALLEERSDLLRFHNAELLAQSDFRERWLENMARVEANMTLVRAAVTK
jgi:hypothetical protein